MITPAREVGPNSGALRSIRSTLPIVPQFEIGLSGPELQRVSTLASRLLAREPWLAATGMFGERVLAGMAQGPALFYEDQSEIKLLARIVTPGIAYRSLLLAGDRDFFVTGCRRHTAFEEYCRSCLGLGRPEVLEPAQSLDRSESSLSVQCRTDQAVLDRLVAAAERAGGMSVIPYLGTARAWALAGAIAERATVDVRIAAPPPRLTRCVNDKLWFARRVRALLGDAALPSTYSVFGPAALAGHVARLAHRHDRIVIKVPDSAGSAGNLILAATEIRPLDPNELRIRLLDQLSALGWREDYPVAVGIWDAPMLTSPSLQYWIPAPEQGPPVCEGLFEQLLGGRACGFMGALPSQLPRKWQERLVHESLLLATLFQQLGYFGRCSFDALLTGEDLARASLHWIECNARWGGVSIPMTAANRLVGDWSRRPFVILHQSGLHPRPMPFEEALERLDRHLLKPPDRDEGVVILSPGGIERGDGLHLMALASTGTAARDLADRAAALLRPPLRE